jgi:HEAT repeat protein
MKHSDLRVRRAALDLLRPVATTREDLRAIWTPLLTDPESQLRLLAVSAISSSKDLLASNGKDLLPLLSDSSPEVRAAVARAARELKEVFGVAEQLTKQLESEPDPRVIAALAESLIALTDPDTRSLPLLRRFLKEGTPSVREEAAKKLGAIGPQASDAVPDLIDRIGDEATEVRIAALQAIARMGRRANDALPIVAPLFDKEQTPAPVLEAAVGLLAAAGPEGMKQLETLSKKLLPISVRTAICQAFAQTDRLSEETRVWMIDQAEANAKSREAVTASLIKTGTDATLLTLLRRTDVYKPGKPGAPPVKYAGDYRKWALITLRQMNLAEIATRGTRGKLIDRLELLTRDADPEVAAEAKAVLSKLMM